MKGCLRQLAASDDVPYSVTTLHRYFSGQALPPRQLIEVISRRCGGNLEALYERASTNGRTKAAKPPPQPLPPRAGIRRWVTVAVTRGKHYTLRFTAWTDEAVKIAVRVQAEEPPHTRAFHKDIVLNPASRWVDHTFTATHSTGSNGQLVFQLGGDEAGYKMFLDNVALVKHSVPL